ncbi:MAG: phosphate/phosphite/phosphonate ABC transporter substrate-binding protein [Elusimicrobiota bacterium]
MPSSIAYICYDICVRVYRRIGPLSVLLLLLSACGGEDLPEVSLAAGERPAATAEREQGAEPLRILLLSITSPKREFSRHEDLVRYIGRQLGRPVDIHQRVTYAEGNSLVESRAVDAAFICSGPYIDARHKFGAEMLAVPVIDARTTYRSYLIVRKDSPIKTFEQLRGKSFAYTDPLSTTGWLYPNWLITQQRGNPATYFSRTFYTHGHDNSIRAVADGLADGAAVHSIILAQIARSDPSLVGKVQIINQSSKFGMPPVVVHPGLDTELKRRLRDAFLGMHHDAEGKKLLAAAGIDRYTRLPDSAYDSVRRMWTTVQEYQRK